MAVFGAKNESVCSARGVDPCPAVRFSFLTRTLVTHWIHYGCLLVYIFIYL
jgi:hypothetical protein